MARLVEVDSSAWPLVVIRIGEALDLPAIDSFMQGIDQVLARKIRFITIVDTSALTKVPNAIERRTLIEAMNKRTFSEKAYNLANAVVLVSAPARAVLTAINWIRPPVRPQHFVSNFEEAVEWCCEQLVLAGIGLSPKVEALRMESRAKAAGSRSGDRVVR